MTWKNSVLPLGFLVVGALVCVSCQSTTTLEPNRAAAVVIGNHSKEDINAAIKMVFEGQGYESVRDEANEQIFQKKGSFMNSFKYGDWYSGAVWERIKVHQRENEPGRTVIDCDVYMVQEHDDPLFQSERKMTGRKRRCQELLNEVAKRLENR